MLKIVVVLGVFVSIFANPHTKENDHPYPKLITKPEDSGKYEDEKTADFWHKNAQDRIQHQLSIQKYEGIAKNVIILMGDGMSVPTLAATRNYISGENYELSFDKFPHTAVSKTYCVDYQVPDSACTSTAYLTGVKANLGTVGVTASIPYGDCHAMTNSSEHSRSTAYHAQLAGKSTGFVTTTRVTHASPSGVFAHSAAREWESDTDLIDGGGDPSICTDIATQLVHGQEGSHLNVIMGGGRYAFLPKDTTDEEGDPGWRSDGKNLINEWKENKTNGKYVWNRKQLLELDLNATDYLLGIFESDHCKYNLERDQEMDPTLEEMTISAIKLLQKNENGFFLFVEGGRIDTAHHMSWAHKAFDETAEFSKAVQAAVDLTSEEDTLIVVTSDHAHTMSFSGYPYRGNDILGLEGTEADDKILFSTINYANGPGFHDEEDGHRHDQSTDDLHDINYSFPSVFPLESETHGGDDVLIFARGPWSHLFSGVMEQTVIPHVMAFASCVGEGAKAPSCSTPNAAHTSKAPLFIILTTLALLRTIY